MTDLRDHLKSTLGDAYTLERELGGGGMSRVFVARENTLGRLIVVKTVPPDAATSVSVDRFKREIQVTAQLQHPHIVPVLSAGESGGIPFYTMPFVKGDTLRERLTKSGELSVSESVHILRAVASALSYAHGEGVVHRDIKPENIILTGGVAVVTDFGVAKAMRASLTAGGQSDGIESEDGHLTSLGVALGTPAYMAPEQAMGDPHVDHRADVYAFGCVAYEMLAGFTPFGGRPLQQLLAAQVTEDPQPLIERRPSVPVALDALVMRCLQKRAGDRPQSATELIAALDAIGTPTAGLPPTQAKLKARPAPRKALLVAVAIALAVVAAFVVSPRFFATRPVTLGAQTPVARNTEIELDAAISPDGKMVAYSAQTPRGMRIFWRAVDGGNANILNDETEGDQFWPAWSPDGSRIAFGVRGRGVFVAPAFGGPARPVVDLSDIVGSNVENVGTPAWSTDGDSLAFVRVNGLWVVSADGGEPRLVDSRGQIHSPAWSPDGRWLAFAEGLRPVLNNSSGSSVWIIPAAGGEAVRISDSTSVNASPVWSVDGKSLLYVSNAGGQRDVYQQAIDRGGRPTGAATRLTTGLMPFRISLSADGSRLAYDVARDNSNVWVADIPAAGSGSLSGATQVTRMSGRIEAVSVSPDGQRLAFDFDAGGGSDIYTVNLAGGDPVRITTHVGNDFAPQWSPDGSEIAFHSARGGAARDIYVVKSDGTDERQVTTGARNDWYPTWTRADELVFESDSTDVAMNYVTKRGPDGAWSSPTPYPLEGLWSGASHLGLWAQGSPAGVTVRSSTSPDVRVVADTVALQGVPQGLARWSPDGRTIFAWSSGGAPDGTTPRRLARFWAIPATGGPPRLLFTEDGSTPLATSDFSTDGRRLFFLRAAYEADVWVMELTPGR